MTSYYKILNESGQNITRKDFDRVNKLITNNFPNSLEFKINRKDFIMTRYNLSEKIINIAYGNECSDVFVLSFDANEGIKKTLEAKTKLKLIGELTK